jgi:hypothetical protein
MTDRQYQRGPALKVGSHSVTLRNFVIALLAKATLGIPWLAQNAEAGIWAHQQKPAFFGV